MRLIFLTAFTLLQTGLFSAQTSLTEMDLTNGTHTVGFQHYIIFDGTRVYQRIYDYTHEVIPRPIAISVWYPAQESAIRLTPLTILDYFEVLKEEEEWEHLPNEQLLNWFSYPNTSSNQQHLRENTSAYADLELAPGSYPIIIYAPSHQASSIENFALCEYLASYGYIVLSSPSRGTKNRWFSNNNRKEMETQARDVEFLMKEARSFSSTDDTNIALLGFSFGGLSNVIVQNRNATVKALVSLDGTERYQYALLHQSPFVDPYQLDVPYMHMAQKDIPLQVLNADGIDPTLNETFKLYDSITRSEAYKLKFNDLTHSHFSTLGVLFENRDRRQDKSDIEIMQSYKWMSEYTLQFLNAYLKNEKKSLDFIMNQPFKNGIDKNRIHYTSKKLQQQLFTFQDFNELASAQNYEHLSKLYDSLIKSHPSMNLPEGNLNTLGLQLVYNPKRSSAGIRVLLFATERYPTSANLFDSLAEGYLFIGDKSKAIKNFEKSLELYPHNTNALKRLKELK